MSKAALRNFISIPANAKIFYFYLTTLDSFLTLSPWEIFHAFLSSADFFQNSFRITIRGSNSLDRDQVQHFVGSDLGTNCLQKLSADDTWR